MFSILNKVKQTYFAAVRSLAFVPTLVALTLTALAFTLIRLEQDILGEDGLWLFRWIHISNFSQASTILSTLLAGLVSLTVFSFSMVMVVINQAAVSFSPKVVTQIVSDRRNHVVLGFYIGSIIYMIILLVNFSREENELMVPKMAFVVATFLGVFALAMFVYFIHHISREIQVKNIIKMIYLKTSGRLEKLYVKKQPVRNEDIRSILENRQWHVLHASRDGYLQGYSDELTKFLKKNDLVIKLESSLTHFIVKGNPIASVSRELSKEEETEIIEYFKFYDEEIVEENVFYGFRQLTEIAVKALSPGINDPGTAKVCIEYLTALLALRAKLPDVEYVLDDEQRIRILGKPIQADYVLDTVFTPIRHYGRQDVSVLARLLHSLKELSYQDRNKKEMQKEYASQAIALIEAAEESIRIAKDRTLINAIVQKMNTDCQGYYHLPELSILK